MTPSSYCAPNGARHELAIRECADGAWQVVDTCATESRVVDTLDGPGDGRAQAEAVARDYVTTVHRLLPVTGEATGEAIPERRDAHAHREPRTRSAVR